MFKWTLIVVWLQYDSFCYRKIVGQLLIYDSYNYLCENHSIESNSTIFPSFTFSHKFHANKMQEKNDESLHLPPQPYSANAISASIVNVKKCKMLVLCAVSQ